MKFQKGQSGNPHGRQKGVCKIQSLRDALMDHVPDIIATLVEQAKAGDVQSAKLILERVLPPLKSVAPSVTLPVDTRDLLRAGSTIIDATTSGTLPVDTGSALMAMLTQQSRLVETIELITRIETLEQELEFKKSN